MIAGLLLRCKAFTIGDAFEEEMGPTPKIRLTASVDDCHGERKLLET
jgi:hypothetical protein